MIERLLRYIACLCMIKINHGDPHNCDECDEIVHRRSTVHTIYYVDVNNNLYRMENPPRRRSI